IIMGHQMDESRLEAKPCTVFGLAEFCCAHRDRLEGRLDVRWRIADGTQNIARSGLLFEGLGHLRMSLRQRLILLLQFREQPYVLDGDDRLVGEGFHQRDLAFGEGSNLVPVDEDNAQQLINSEHRNREYGPDWISLEMRKKSVLGIGFGIENVDRAMLEGSTSGSAVPSGSVWICFDESSKLGCHVVRRHYPQQLTVEAIDESALGFAQPDRVLGQRLEDRPEVERGP